MLRLRRDAALAGGAAALALTGGLVLVLGSAAQAGSYSARFCAAGVPPFGDAGPFQRIAHPQFNLGDCNRSIPLSVTPESQEPISRGEAAEWRLEIPHEIAVQRVEFRARGQIGAGFDPRVVGTRPDGSRQVYDRDELTIDYAPHSMTGDLEQFGVVLACASGTCDTSRDPSAGVFVRGIDMTIVDPTPPTLEVGGGTLFDGAAQRDVQQVDVLATDGGGGVWQVLTRVNGKELPPLSGNCTLGEGFAAKLPPCPAAFDAPLYLDTRGSPWRQGLNRVEICARDYATSGANETCTPPRRVRVENGCALNTTYPTDLGRTLELSFAKGRTLRTVGQADRPRMYANLRDASGAALGGARVCIYEQRSGSKSERLVSQAITDSSGVAAVRLNAGPSRKLRATYWFTSAEGVLVDTARLSVRPRVGLQLTPGGTLSNGDRMRLAAKLSGPYRTGRRVCFWVKQPRKPVRLGCARTDKRGIADRRHRFTQVTGGRATFRFYVTVPKQRGYPYAKGVSKLKRKTVRG